MISQVLKSFHRILVLQTPKSTYIANTTFPLVYRKFGISTVKHLSLSRVRHLQDNRGSSVEISNTADSSFVPATNQPDSRENKHGYIVEYCLEHERPRRHVLVEALRTRYRLSNKDVDRIMRDEVVKSSYHKRSLTRSLELLCLEGVSKESFLSYPWILTLDKGMQVQEL